MKINTTTPDALDQYLSTASDDRAISFAVYVERGSRLVTAASVRSLQSKLPALRTKAALVKDSDQLRQRIGIMTSYLDHTAAAEVDSDIALRDVAFALFYFLKGYDRIPDSIPEIGFLDDAIIVNAVFQWHQTILKAHCMRCGSPWPNEAP